MSANTPHYTEHRSQSPKLVVGDERLVDVSRDSLGRTELLDPSNRPYINDYTGLH